MAATYGLTMNAPTSDRNSPTKPLRPGNPADANAKNPNATDRSDRRGEPAHLRDRPVVGPLVDHADEQEQRPGDQAGLTIWMIAPCIPCSLNTKIRA